MRETMLIGIVDDDSELPIALSSLVRSLGYRSECFSSAADLLKRGHVSEFSCVISDIHMPVMNGLELAVRLGELDASLPVILMTGKLEPGLEQKVHDSGAAAFVTKPFDFDMLSQTLARSFARKPKPLI